MSTNNSANLKSSILCSATVISLATLLSRISGFVRDVVLAYFFGTGTAIQAFIVALRLPNLLRDLVGEGITNTTMVPVFSKLLAAGKREEFLRLCRFIFKFIFIALVVIVLIAQIIAPVLVRLIAPGFYDNIAKLTLTIKLTRITFIYILLIGVVAFHTSMLNSLNNFAPSAIGPVFLNISLIVGAFISVKILPVPIVGLAWAVVAGGILQVAVQAPALRKYNIRSGQRFFDFSLDEQTKASSQRIARLFWPRLIGSAVYQLNVFVDTIMASLSFLVGQGAIAAIYYANRIIQLPLGVFAFALSNALLPQLSSLVHNKDEQRLAQVFYFAMKAITSIMVPMSLFICLQAVPITQAVFQRGQFSAFSTQITSLTLLFYGLGVFFFAGVRIVLVCFYAFEDTLRPVQTASICLLANVILNFILAIPLKVGGLALASSLSSLLNLTLLCALLKRRHLAMLDYRLVFGLPLVRIILCSLVMVLVSRLAWQFLFLGWPLLIRLALNIILAAGIYILTAFLGKIEEVTETIKWILKKE
jgi:putative peptidoglycan lipid II flippase